MIEQKTFLLGRGGKEKRDVVKINSCPALASCPVANAKLFATGVSLPQFFVFRFMKCAVKENLFDFLLEISYANNSK
jgi:hypothetical protein